ncbi:MAG: hypothetical protein Q9168_004360 [Polycauliona sp. 1 TL-2023]
MIYGYLFQGTEVSIAVRTFRKHMSTRPGRSPGVTAIKEKFRVARYDSKSRLHWDQYYSEFGNTLQKDLPKGISTAILRVNSHIHQEAEPVLYKSHTFDFGAAPKAALAFYQTLPQAAIPFIPRIRFDLCYTSYRNENEFAKTCNALIKISPNIKFSTKLTFIVLYPESMVTVGDVASWSSVRALARMHGLKSLRSEKGKKFASGFADLVPQGKRTTDKHGNHIVEIHLNVR